MEQDRSQQPPGPARPPLFRPEAVGESAYGTSVEFRAPSGRAIGLLFAGMILASAAFASLADFDRSISLRGSVIAASDVVHIRAPRDGAIASTFVRQGDFVHARSPLLSFETIASLQDGTRPETEVVTTLQQESSTAAKDSRAQQEELAAQRDELQETLAANGDDLHSLEAEVALQHERVANSEARLEQLTRLKAKGYVSDAIYRSAVEASLAQKHELAEEEGRRVAKHHEQGVTRARIAALEARLRASMHGAEERQFALRRSLAAARSADQVSVIAPVAGTVSFIRDTAGQAVRSGDEVAAIAPPGPLRVMIVVPVSARGAVAAGDEVGLRFDAFPFETYGVARGIVTSVASSASPEAGALGYRTLIRLADDRGLKLKPDMGLTAVVNVERRSLLGWIFEPAWNRLNHAGGR